MHAYIIIASEIELQEKRLSELLAQWQIQPIDQYTVSPAIEGKSIGIEDVRILARNLFLMPQASPVRAGIIKTAEALTTQAQHALLKILEEPPSRTRIILMTNNDSSLLPTILSRCMRIHIAPRYSGPDVSREQLQILSSLIKESPGKRLLTVESICSNRQNALTWVYKSLACLHSSLLNNLVHGEINQESILPAYTTTSLIRGLLEAANQLTANVNPRLAIGNALIALPPYL